MNLVRTIAPTAYPVTLAEAKAYCAVTHSDEDALILSLVAAATSRFDGYSGILGRCLVTQTWSMTLPYFPDRLPLAPVQSATMTYFDTDDAEQPFADFRLTGECLEPLESWPSVATRADAVTITFVSGYGAPSDVPEDLRGAILLLTRFLYDNRGDEPADMPPAIHMLAAPYRARFF